MRAIVPRWLVLLCTWAALVVSVAPAQAQVPADNTAAKSPPAGFVAPADPKADETNAQRAKSQPGNNAPFWRSVRDSGNREGVSSLPGAEKGVLIQPFVQYPGSRLTNAGEAWRQVRNLWIIPYGGALLFLLALALGIFYWRRGPIGQEHPDSGRMIERFTPFERAAHWTNAIAFVILAVSGLVMAFGKYVLLPVFGSTLFGWLAYALKNAHNFAGPLFAVSLVVVFVTFVRHNIADVNDWKWLKTAGGLFSEHQLPSGRFNAAEKGLFWWGMMFPGLVAVGAGLVLDGLIPGFGEVRGEMQIASLVHSAASIWMMFALAGHIYMGTIGTRQAYRAMRWGVVNEGWAREHHELWLADIEAGRIPAQRSATPPAALGSATPQA